MDILSFFDGTFLQFTLLLLPFIFLMGSIDAADIVNEWGKYYIPGQQNMNRLLQQLRLPRETVRLAQQMITSATEWRGAKTELGDVVQPFQKEFTENGTLKFTPRTIKLFRLKADLKFYPDDIVESWLGFLARNNLDRRTWPITRYFAEQEVMPQIFHDLEAKAYWDGKQVDPTAGTAGAPSEALDGLKTHLDDGVTNGNMNEVNLTNTPSPSTMVDAVEEFVDSFSEAFEMQPIVIGMSKKFLKDYFRDKRNTFGSNVSFQDEDNMVDYLPNARIIGLPSMSGSDYIWATTQSNFKWLQRQNGITTPRVENVDRQVKFYTDWWEGLGFGLDELVYVYRGSGSGSGSGS